MAIILKENAPYFHINNKRKLKQWIKESVVNENYIPEGINFVFDTDEVVYKVNVKFLKHDWYTDVISFDYNKGKKIYGDILISVDRVMDNAKKFGVTMEVEMRRVMIHGVLHLCGYSDETEEERKLMKKTEDKYLCLWEKIMKGE